MHWLWILFFFALPVVGGAVARHFRNRWQAWLVFAGLVILSLVCLSWPGPFDFRPAFWLVFLLSGIGLLGRNLARGLCRAAESPRIWTRVVPILAVIAGIIYLLFHLEVAGRIESVAMVPSMLVLLVMGYGFWYMLGKPGRKKKGG